MSEEPNIKNDHESDRFFETRILASNTTLEILQRPGPGVKPRSEEFNELFGPLGTGWIFVPEIGEEDQKLQPIGTAQTTQEGERYAREGALPSSENNSEPKLTGLKAYIADRKRRKL